MIESDFPPAKRSVLIISADLGSNTSGRALNLASALRETWDVTIFGPIRRTKKHRGLWPPIVQKSHGIKVCSFENKSLAELTNELTFLLARSRFDLVIVSKTRLVSLTLGRLCLAQTEAVVVLDEDDDEWSLVRGHRQFWRVASKFLPIGSNYSSPLALAGAELLSSGFHDRWTPSWSLVSENQAYLIPHSQPEDFISRLAVEDRDHVRKTLGIQSDDFSIVFAGTIRRHKGLKELATAIGKTASNRPKLVVYPEVGEKRLRELLRRKTREKFIEARGLTHEEVLSVADAVVINNLARFRASQVQVPMKAVDAIFTDAVLLTSPVKPMEILIKEGLFESFLNSGLCLRLEELVLQAHLEPQRQHLVYRSVWRKFFSHREVSHRIENRVQWLENEKLSRNHRLGKHSP